MKMKTGFLKCIPIFILTVLSDCSSPQIIPTVPRVDVSAFMGDWYVIANIPTFLEKGAHNAVESYTLNKDGSIAVNFTFRDGDFNGALKNYRPSGYVMDETGSYWEMQFLWPFRSEYRIVYLDPEGKITMIGRSKRDYVWIMARKPTISDEEFKKLTLLIESLGYDSALLQKVPQRWTD